MKPLAFTLAIVFFIVAILYAAGILQFGAHHPGKHLSHALLFAVLGILCLVWVRFQGNATASRL